MEMSIIFLIRTDCSNCTAAPLATFGWQRTPCCERTSLLLWEPGPGLTLGPARWSPDQPRERAPIADLCLATRCWPPCRRLQAASTSRRGPDAARPLWTAKKLSVGDWVWTVGISNKLIKTWRDSLWPDGWDQRHLRLCSRPWGSLPGTAGILRDLWGISPIVIHS